MRTFSIYNSQTGRSTTAPSENEHLAAVRYLRKHGATNEEVEAAIRRVPPHLLINDVAPRFVESAMAECLTCHGLVPIQHDDPKQLLGQSGVCECECGARFTWRAVFDLERNQALKAPHLTIESWDGILDLENLPFPSDALTLVKERVAAVPGG